MWRKTRNKFGNAMAGGSRLEESVYQLLCLREKAGEIKDLSRQHTIVLQDGPREERITWRVDFAWVNVATGQAWFGEAKGMETYDYQLKVKMFKGRRLGNLEIWKGSARAPRLAEVYLCPR